MVLSLSLAAKKKQVKHSNNSNSSSTTHSNHGESDGGELGSPAAQDQHNQQPPFNEGEVAGVEKREDNSSQNKSITIGSTVEAGKEEEGNIEIDKGSKSRKSHDSSSSSSSSSDDESHVFEKKVVVLESSPAVELVQPIEPLPEKIAHEVEYPAQEVEDPAVETSSVLDPVRPADSQLEVVSHVNDDTGIKENAPLVPELDKSAFLEQTCVVNGSASKDNCSTSSVVVESVLEENKVAKFSSLDENASSESRDDVTAPAYPMGSVSGVNGADRVNVPEMLDYSDKQPLVASAPGAAQTTSWKSCCGIIALFSSSDR